MLLFRWYLLLRLDARMLLMELVYAAPVYGLRLIKLFLYFFIDTLSGQ